MEYSGKQVTIMACSDCNVKCKHCYISYTGNLDGKKLLEICQNLKGKYKIIINGTEPLIHDDYIDALCISDQKRILTNGIIIYNNRELLDKIFKTGIKTIAMSYHFNSDVSNVPAKIIEENIKAIKESNLNVELMCTITSKNYDKLDSICERTIKLGIHKIRLFNCLKVGNALNSSNILTDNQLKIFFDNLKEVRSKYKKEELTIKRNGLFGKDESNPNSHFKCIAGQDEVVITPDGNVYPCIFMTKKGYEIGKYIDGKIILDHKIINPSNDCIALEIFNKNKENTYIKKLND